MQQGQRRKRQVSAPAGLSGLVAEALALPATGR